MKFTPVNPVRRFEVGRGTRVEMRDCGSIELDPEEQAEGHSIVAWLDSQEALARLEEAVRRA